MSEQIRLLFCLNCNSIDELPDYDGPAEHDSLLEFLITDRHTFPSGDRHVAAFGGLAKVAKSEWENPTYRKAIIEKANETIRQGGSEGLGSAFYDARNTFQEDAHSCWKYHGRTKNCGDYKSDAKRLIPDTREERKELGLAKTPAVSRYLCEFCPFHSIAMQRARARAGEYDYTD